MRRILFRGKRTDTKEWVYGWYCKYPFGRWPISDCIIPSDSANCGYFEHFEVIPETVSEYSGKKDKNGVEIFEGDIVNTKYGRKCVVYWFLNKPCFDLKPIETLENLKHKCPDEWDLWRPEYLEVIGNIYEKTDLGK